MRLEINKKDYYSDYSVDTFLNLVNLQSKITRLFVDVDLLNAAVFWFTNVEREKYNLKQFQFHSKLKETAVLHSEQMKIHNFFNHENAFDLRYNTLTDRFNLVKNKDFQGFVCGGENISDYPIFRTNEKFTIENRNGKPRFFSMSGTEIFPYSYYEFAKIVVDGWMNSPGHRANILNPEFVYLGCGCASYDKKESEYSMLYFKLTQNFGGKLIADSFSLGLEI